MRLNARLLRTRSMPAARVPILRYGVAILSIILALIPALLLPGVIESRLVVFAVAVMVSAWYGGWKPGLVATSFALTVSAYFSITAARVPADYRRAITHLTLFVVVALLICWFNAALRSAQQGMRQSESNFRSLVTNAPYGICRCDSAGMLLDVNLALVTILGYTSSSELAGRNLANLYANSQHWFTLADYFRSLQHFNDLLAEWVRKDGSLVNVRLSGRAITEHTTLFFELFIEDVSERRALEQQLRQAQKMEAVGRLAGGIAHDFNNLLMVLSGYCEFLLERTGTERALRGPVQEIANAAERATSLTRQLLAFSRKQMLAPKVVNLNAVVKENLNMLRRVIGEDIDLLMLPGAELGAVKADPGQIEQVIMNLAVNARDAMPRGGKLIIETANVTLGQEFARLHAPVAPGEYVMLAISDTGLGMDAATQARIFEPFFSTKGPKGTGLGLSTVYGIVQQSGGHIEVSSEVGKGASFNIYFPRLSAAGQPIATEPVVASAKPEQAHGTILLVEDESNLRSLVREYLEKQGYTVLEAGDGTAAIQVASVHSKPIHLLLTDVVMPGMSGRELANCLSSLRPKLRVLYMSGYTDLDVTQNSNFEEEIVLLQKPFNLAVLKNKVKEALERTRPEDASVDNRLAEQARTVTRDNLSFTVRAQRFNLHVPLKYRLVGQMDWREGSTENISRSGMLFRAQELVPIHSQLEINLVLPWEIAGLAPTEVVCRGEVVRTLEYDQFATRPALAAKILRYQFQSTSQQTQA